MQRDELRTAVEKLRRQMLRKSREYDCQVLQERMELLHQAHQVTWLYKYTFEFHDKNIDFGGLPFNRREGPFGQLTHYLSYKLP